MRVRDLVAKAGGLKQEANQETAHLERYEDGAEAAVLTLNLVDHWDDRLHNRDYLRIYAGGEAVPTAPRPTHRPRLYEGWHIADLNIGILYILALTSLGVYGIVLAGWASNNKWSLLGGIRSSAQMISYELGMGLAILAVVLVTGTLSLRGIVEAQDFGLFKWFFLWQFPAFVLYAICGCAEVNRAPFDLPEAESELVAGYHTEYSSFKFAMFFMGEYAAMITVSAVATSLFLGGWQSPFTNWPWLGLLTVQNVPVLNWFAPLFWFLAKIFLGMFVFMWIRATLPRIRYDRLMKFGWKFLLPAGLVWLMVVALFEALWPGHSWVPSVLVVLTVGYLWKRPRAA
jgi:NADH-quinone oxidoreductase subunit H